MRAGLTHAPERRRICPGLTVHENLEVATAAWRRLGASIAGDVERVFTLFTLRERRGQYGWSLSGDEQQMLAVGRALMSRPKALLLDVPSLGLERLACDRPGWNHSGRESLAQIQLDPNGLIQSGRFGSSAEAVHDRLAEIGRMGVTILVIEQNTATALSVASRAYLPEYGSIVLEDPAADLAGHSRIREACLGA